MICNKYGMQVGENNLYCTNCGNKLDDFIIDIKLAKKKKNIKNIRNLCSITICSICPCYIYRSNSLLSGSCNRKEYCGLNFNLFGMCCAALFIISIILVILKSKLK